MTLFKKKSSFFFPWFVFILLLSIVCAAYLITVKDLENDYELKFKTVSEKITKTIKNRMAIHELILRGGTSLFSASKEVSRDEWRKYVQGLNLKVNWPGIQGIGYAVMVKPKDKEKHIKQIHAEGFKDYKIKPEGKREAYSAIIFLEPFDWRNQRAFGYDMWSNNVRREAMMYALETGKASTSGLITLVQETNEDVQKGFLTYLPVYKNDAEKLETPEDRKRYFLGWVYSPFRAGDLFSEVADVGDFQLDFEVYDNANIDKESLLYTSSTGAIPEPHKVLSSKIAIQGRTWLIRYHALRPEVYFGQMPLIVLITGIMISFLIFFILVSLKNVLTKAEKLAEKKASETQMILDGTGLGIWTYYPKTEKLVWDDSMYALYDIQPKNFTGHYDAWEKLVHPEDVGRTVIELNEHVNGDVVFDTRFRIKSKTGDFKHIRAKSQAIRDETGHAVKVMGFNWDVSQEENIKRDLEAQRKVNQHHSKLAAIGELAAGVGHEINNPLTIIKGYLNVMLKKSHSKIGLGEKELHEYLQKIDATSDRIANIVKGLRNFSRSDTSTIQKFDAIEALKESVNLLKEIYRSNGIDLVLEDNCQTKVYLKGNRGRLEQVFINLLSNAKDAIEDCESKKITVKTSLVDDGLEISFSDNGVGISEQVQEKIFDPFFTTKEVDKGTGIGLSLVHNFVKEFDGSIDVNSQINSGTTFVLNFPCLIEEQSQSESLSSQINIDELKIRAKALVVDDEKVIREFLGDLLRDIGLEVEFAEDGQKALRLCDEKEESFDIIFSDIQMPNMSGFEFFLELKKKNARSHLVLMTGDMNLNLDDQNHIHFGLCSKCIFKPFSKEVIYSVILEQFNKNKKSA
jgi:signal transduction histidine kinase/CHASE1-domain containing sensor protein/ActR/RegA family two-component response regulator